MAFMVFYGIVIAGKIIFLSSRDDGFSNPMFATAMAVGSLAVGPWGFYQAKADTHLGHAHAEDRGRQ